MPLEAIRQIYFAFFKQTNALCESQSLYHYRNSAKPCGAVVVEVQLLLYIEMGKVILQLHLVFLMLTLLLGAVCSEGESQKEISPLQFLVFCVLCVTIQVCYIVNLFSTCGQKIGLLVYVCEREQAW